MSRMSKDQDTIDAELSMIAYQVFIKFGLHGDPVPHQAANKGLVHSEVHF